jgi:hypothetical protein
MTVAWPIESGKFPRIAVEAADLDVPWNCDDPRGHGRAGGDGGVVVPRRVGPGCRAAGEEQGVVG